MDGVSKYCIKKENNYAENYHRVIVSLYMPLIGTKATTLYFFFSQQQVSKYYTLEYLCTIMDAGIDEVEKDIISLEKFGLLKTLKKDNKYIFNLLNPLTVKTFFEHDIYPRLLLKQIGKNCYEIIKTELTKTTIETEGFEDVTHSLDKERLKQWNQENEDEYQQTNKLENYQDVIIDFDYDWFLRNCTDLVFPMSLRTKENLTAIGKLATVFAVPVEKMRKLVSDSIDKDKNVLEIDLLRKKCVREKSVNVRNDLSYYKMEPVSFLFQKQGFPVSSTDKKLLEFLITELKLNYEVINYLIEYILDNNDNNLSTNYVEKIATTWARQRVDTIEKAKEQISKSTDFSNKKKVFGKEEMEVPQQDIEELRKKLFNGQ